MKKLLSLRLLTVAALLSVSVIVYADPVRPLKLGEKLPDILLGEALNFPARTSNVTVSDFKGKLLILDFWSIYCPSCLEQFPKIEKLQQQFNKEVFILTVGFDGLEDSSIKKYISKRVGTPVEMKLPTVIQKRTDTVLQSYFPFKQLPHMVWIDESGSFIGVTNARALNADNIVMALRGKKFPERIIDRVHLDPDKNFLVARNLPDGTNAFGSAFSSKIDTLKIPNLRFDLQPDSSIVRLTGVNHDIVSYYHLAHSYLLSQSKKRLQQKKIVADKNGEIFYQPFSSGVFSNLDMKKKFCYELVLPKTFSVSDAFKWMLKDLNRFFNTESRFEKRQIKSLALIRTSKKQPFASSSDPSGEAMLAIDSVGFRRTLTSFTMKEFVEYLDYYVNTPYSVIDETGFREKINIELTLNDQSHEIIRKTLAKYDLDLVEVVRSQEVLVLYER